MIQSALFKLIAEEDEEYAKHLHDIAYGGKTKYKFFAFGELKGRNHFHDKKLYYEGDIRLEVRSISEDFINIFAALSQEVYTFSLGKYQLPIKKLIWLIIGLKIRLSQFVHYPQ